jgi:hypothetical protein
MKKEGRNPDKNLNLRRLKFMPRDLSYKYCSRILSQCHVAQYGYCCKKGGGGVWLHIVHANLLADKDCRLLYSSQKIPVVFTARKMENTFTLRKFE